MKKFLPLIVLLAVGRAHAQAPARPGSGITLTAAELMAAPAPPGLRIGLAPLPAAGLLRPMRVPTASPRSASGPLYPGSPVPVALWPDAAGWTAPRRSPGALPAPRGSVVSRTGASAGDTLSASGASPGAGLRELHLAQAVQDVADLHLRVEGRGDLGGVWNEYRPCEPGLRLNCSPGVLPQLRPDVQFGVQVGGTITDRLHVDVDYDQRREFDAANNISVYYQGEPGELLQRVEMGDVSIDLPASRYLTQGIPAGNFGFKAAAQVGPAKVEALWAQQKGNVATREFRLGGQGAEGLVQEQELVLDDADYVSGQFFFLVDPSRLSGAPHVDVLTLRAGDAPASLRPARGRLAVFRDEGASAAQYADQARTGKFLANAVSPDGSLHHSGLFTLLEPGQDYYLHSSGLWIALRAPLRDDESLAVTYVTDTGVVVGDPSPETVPAGRTPELRLIRGPVTVHQPGQDTWPYEMHQVYRLDSSADVETSSLALTISLGHLAGGVTFEQRGSDRIPFLRLLGLDDDAPADVMDLAHLFRPGAELKTVGQAALRGTFIVFPTLQPFARPPPVPAEGLSAAEAAAVLGGDANPAIYEQPDPVVRRGSSRFRLNFRYRVQLEGLLSSFNLGAFGIRQGSERITVDDRLLLRGQDYVIDYDLGLVTFLDPASVLGGNPDAVIRASWEQNAIFDIAPTSVLGLNATSPLGRYGELNLMGLYRAQQAIVARPQLGTTPGAVLLGGASGRMAFEADWLARALAAVPGLRADSAARMDVSGELALSSPDPNRQGATYLDDFEATDEVPLSLDAREWKLGSAPQDATAVPQLPWPPSVANAASLVWQDRYLSDDRELGFLTPDHIDQKIAFAGARLSEPVLHLTMRSLPTTTAPLPHWRSITTVLSTTGRDLSRSEYLEFYAAPYTANMGDAVLVVDLGTVSEDAFYFDSTGAREGTGAFGRPWGRGVLDEEASLALRDVWGPDDDRQGLWAQSCEAERLKPVPLGDPRANCTVDNGRPDTEDLNGNGVLDASDGPLFRYVIPLGQASPYLVRDQTATGTAFRLFRIPLRGGSGTGLNGASEATWRYIKQLRLTVVKQSGGVGTLALARLRIAGSRWTKRDIQGILGGLLEDAPGSGAATTALRVGSVSRLTDGSAYISPPGVQEQLQDPKSVLGASGVEYNEKSLRLSWDGLPAGERAEVYYRYPQQPRSFLDYRKLRFWAVPRAGRWGPKGDYRLLVKLGTDARNYYLYQTRLRPLAGGGNVSPEDWLPEHEVDFAEWFALKAEAERRLADGAGPLTVWSEDSTYAVVLEDRARAPNLAAVRELTFAVYNDGAGASDGEVWMDDLRLDAGARATGMAGRLDVGLTAGGFLSASLSYGGRGGRFRQLDDAAPYETSGDLRVATTADLGRFAPESWGLAMPVTVTYDRRSLAPIFLQGTDVRADQLPGLRGTGTSHQRVAVALRKTTPTENPLLSAVVDGTSLHLGYSRMREDVVTTASRLNGVDGGVDVDRTVAPVELDIVPAFIENALRWLAPARLERSEFFHRLTDAHLRLTPERLGLSGEFTGEDAAVWRYDQVLERPGDADVQPLRSPRRTLEGGARVAFRPLESLSGHIAVTSGRDILDPVRATPVAAQQEALVRARTEIAGVPLGWERDRVVTSDLAYAPVLADWLRPSLSWTSQFGQRREPSHVELVDGPDGTTAELERTFNTERRLSRRVLFDPAAALSSVLGAGGGEAAPGPASHAAQDSARPAPADSTGARPATATAAPGLLSRILLAATSPLQPLELAWTDAVGSRFDRELAAPGWGYQVGLGALGGFRYVDGDTAATALETDGFRARSGLRLGASATLDIGYGRTLTRVYDLRAGRRDQGERSWPDVQLNLRDLPVPPSLARVLDGWSFATGYVRTVRELRLLGPVTRVHRIGENTIPLEVRLSFAGGLSLAYIASRTRGDGRDPAGTTAEHAQTHSLDVSGRFAAPAVLAGRGLSEPIRLTLGYDYQAQRECRAEGNRVAAECTDFVDYLNRRLNISISTLVRQLDVGLQGSYVDRRSFIGTLAGSSQFQLGLFGQFNMQAGVL